MATTNIEFSFVPGQTLTVDLFPVGSDTAAVSGKSATERTNANGVYTISVIEAVAGTHRAVIRNGGNAVGYFFAEMVDEAVTLQEQADAKLDAAVSSRASQTTVDNIPRKGETMRHRQVAADDATKSADVVIEDAV